MLTISTWLAFLNNVVSDHDHADLSHLAEPTVVPGHLQQDISKDYFAALIFS